MTELDIKAIEEYFTLGITLNHKTFIKGKKYLDIEPLKYNGVTGKASLNEVVKTLENGILDACKGKKNIVLELSGGKDSRLIAAVLNKYGIDFSAVVYGDGEKCMDVRVARLIAKMLRIPITQFDTKNAFNKETSYAVMKANHGLRPHHSLAMQYYCRNFLKQFDLVLNGDFGHYVFSVYFYPNGCIEKNWRQLLDRFDYFLPCCVNSKMALQHYISEYYDKTIAEASLMHTNMRLSLDVAATRSWGITCKSPINQKLVNAVCNIPIRDRGNILLAQRVLKKIDKKLLLLPYASWGILPLALPFPTHVYWSKLTKKCLPKWRFSDPSNSRHYIKVNFTDYIKTLPDFVRGLSMLKTNVGLDLLTDAQRYTTSGVQFKNRLMNFKLWSDVNEIH